MSTSVGSIHYDLALDKSRFDSGANEVHGQLEDIADRAGRVAKRIAVAFSAMAVAATGFAVKSAADFEQTRIGLENMLGSADSARSVLREISDFAATTPFEFPELAGAARQLIAFGFNAEEGLKTMKQLGDVSAAVGAPIGDLAYLMGTLRTQGRAFTVDIRQFAQRGIPIYEYLAKVLNTNEKQLSTLIETGKVGFPEVQKAFEMMTAEGGKFHGTMAKQSKSLSGQFSTLKDNIGAAARELVGINNEGDIREGSVFAILQKAVGGLNDELGKIDWASVGNAITTFGGQLAKLASKVADYLNPHFKELWNSIENTLMPALQRLWKDVLEPLMPVLGSSFVVALALAIDALVVLSDTVSVVVSGITDIANGIKWVVDEFNKGNPVVITLTGAFGGLAAAMALNATFAALTSGFNTLTVTTIPAVMAKMSALSALVATPMVMPAIAIGAAIAALIAVQQQAQATLAAIDEATASRQQMYESNDQLAQTLYRLRKSGTPQQKANAERLGKKLGVPGFAEGTSFAPGGTALVGERGPELVNLPRGSQVIPNHQLSGQTFNIYLDGVMARSRSDLRDIGKDILGAINEELRAKNMPQLAGGAL